MMKFKILINIESDFFSTLCWKHVFCSFFDIHYPDVFVTAEQGGNLTIRVNNSANIFLTTIFR